MAKKLVFDRLLFGTVGLLVAFGLVMVYSASEPLARLSVPVAGPPSGEPGPSFNPFLVKQAVSALIGFAVMALAMHVDYRRYRRSPLVYLALGGALVLLVAVLFGPLVNNTHRWFVFGPLSLQPSELAKLALVPVVALWLARSPDRVDQPEVLVPILAVTGLVAGLVVLQPDFGTAVLIIAAVGLMLFVAGLGWRRIAAAVAVAVPTIAILAVVAPYRRRRLLAFLDPESDPLGAGFQANQALIAVGSGGLLGLGPGASVQKLHFLPQAHSDYIFAIVCEELGLLGGLVVLGAFAVLLWRGVRAGLGAPDLFGRHLAFGFTGLLVLQALLHVSVSLAMAPSKGIPLPFISYGGSSLVVSMAACGVLLNVSQHG